MDTPGRVDLTREEADALLERVKTRKIQDTDYELFSELIRFSMWLQFKLQEARISINRLKKIFNIKTEKKR